LSESEVIDEAGQGTIDPIETIERCVRAAVPGRRSCVLVVEDPVAEGALLGPLLERAGFTVRECADGFAGLDAFIRELPDVIVARDRLAGLDGLELVRRVREISDVPVVLVGAADSPWIRERALRLGVDRFVTEPGELESLPLLALDLAESIRPRRGRRRLTAAHVRRIARSELRAELERLLVDCRGNLAEMARRMGKDRSTVRYHLRRFGMLADERVVWTDSSEREAPQDVSASA
jgi:CheY-like chemotaxis protein